MARRRDREISLSREIAPILGAPHRIRTFHIDHSKYLSVRLGTARFAINKVISVTLPVIRTGAAKVNPTVEVHL